MNDDLYVLCHCGDDAVTDVDGEPMCGDCSYVALDIDA